MRIFLDANVLFSASNSSSAVAVVVAVASAHATVVSSDLACIEARRNLAIKRPDWLEVLEKLVENIETVPSSAFALPVALADKDVPLLCAAIRAEADYFVTGDRKDFGHLFGSSVHDVEVITPVRLGEILLGRFGE